MSTGHGTETSVRAELETSNALHSVYCEAVGKTNRERERERALTSLMAGLRALFNVLVTEARLISQH